MSRAPRPHVVGVDLSLRAAAACAIPLDWDRRGHDLRRLRTIVVGGELHDPTDELERVGRLDRIERALVEFCREHRAVSVAVEQYAMGTGRQAHKHAIGEVGGAFKLGLFRRRGEVAQPLVASASRKVFAGKLPRAGVKKWIVAQAARLGPPVDGWTADEVDAFVTANHAYMLAGRQALTLVG